MTTKRTFPVNSLGTGLLAMALGWTGVHVGNFWVGLVGWLAGILLAVGRPLWWMWRGKHRGVSTALGVVLFALPILAQQGHVDLGWGWSFLLYLTGLALTVTPWIVYWRRGRLGARAAIERRRKHTEAHGGFTSRMDRMRWSSRRAMRTRWARSLRPSLAHGVDVAIPDFGQFRFVLLRPLNWRPVARLGNFLIVRPLERRVTAIVLWWKILRVSTFEYAARLGKDEFGSYWIPLNSIVLRLGMVRSGKTSAQLVRIIEHRGAVVNTSTRKDVLEFTQGAREDMGPVLIFNAGNVGGITSTLKWSVLIGCGSIDVAKRRAYDLVRPSRTGSDRDDWKRKGAELLGALMFTAHHGQATMGTVLRWLTATGQDADKAERQIRQILEDTGATGRAVWMSMAQFWGMKGEVEKTRQGIVNAALEGLTWMNDPATRSMGDAPIYGPDAYAFDIRRDLIDAKATLYVLGAATGSSAVLTGCLIAEIVEVARAYAEECPRGRLDPPMLMALDELPLTVPGPVPDWVKDMSGRGMVFDLVAQQVSGLIEIWGRAGAESIVRNATVLIGRGGVGPEDAQQWAMLSGERYEPRVTENASGNVASTTKAVVSAMGAGQLQQIQTGQAAVFSPGQRITVLKTPFGEKDPRIVRGMARMARAKRQQVNEMKEHFAMPSTGGSRG